MAGCSITKPQIRALSVRQPWAWAIVNRYKRVGNRTWFTRYRGALLIHASKTKRDHGYIKLVARYSGQTLTHFESNLDYGAIVGACNLSDVLAPEERTPQPEWSLPGYMHWVLTDALALREPCPCAGKLGLWRPDEFAVEWTAADLALWSIPGLQRFPDLATFLGGELFAEAT